MDTLPTPNPATEPPKKKQSVAVITGAILILLVAVGAIWFAASRGWIATHPAQTPEPTRTSSTTPSLPDIQAAGDGVKVLGADIAYQAPTTTIDPRLNADFDMNEVSNVADMEKAYGFTFNAAELKALADRKFVVKKVTDTSIKPSSSGDNPREFIQLYNQVSGTTDFRARGPQNSLFFSSDVFFNAYNNLYTELLKEMENKDFSPAMSQLSQELYQGAADHLASASTDADKKKWTKVRNYFAVPYAIFSTEAATLTNSDYRDAQGNMRDPNDVMNEFNKKDATVDTADNVSAFIKKLGLDIDSETAVLSDVKNVFDAKTKAAPAIFADEYQQYAAQEKIAFSVDFTQFTPRGTYTGSSLRREYFRGMKWYIMLPFFLKSPDLTTYAYAVTQLLAEHPDALANYNKLESAINFMVGGSDDLMPADYLQSLVAAKGQPDETQAALAYLVAAHNPKIKDLAATYSDVGTQQSDDVLLKTKGLRFFSGKFIIDSYWTGYLTQGDEAPRPGYTQKLPPMASALEVMSLLGSDYAKSQIPTLDFYKPTNSKAIDQALAALKTQEDALTDSDWQENLYTGWLWTIKGLFGWQQTNKAALPRFMQSVSWEAKTLQTAAAWWTELRHATILYAKQSFAELGGGGGDCDPRKIPPPPKGYIEPQLEAYHRLNYLAHRTYSGLNELGFKDLSNLDRLNGFSQLMDTVEGYVNKELSDATLNEQITSQTLPDPTDPSKTCVQYDIASSDWETLRLKIINMLSAANPTPIEGPILSAKDRRAAIVADVHTGGDSDNPTRILYEGEGVPYVIFTAVKDANGPRLTVGFISSQYEFTQGYGGQRMTDEDWQKNFYTGDDPYNAYAYTNASTWPKTNPWYAPIFP